MDGRTALIYCRSRKRTSDFDRSRRQQEVLVALWKKALTVEVLAQAPQLWTEFKDAYETDLSMGDAIQTARVMYGIGLENVHSKTLDHATVWDWTTPQGAQVLIPRLDVIRQSVLDLLSEPG
jgi:anionic cell wall polymer biosynthesis LytR-Cps2A-Psr (LCP) family protein